MTRKREPSGRKRTSFARRCGASEPTSSPLKESATGSATSVLRFGDAASAAVVVSSGSTWSAAARTCRAPVSAACSRAASSCVGSIASPGRDGAPRTRRGARRPGRAGASGARREALRRAPPRRARHEHGVDEQRRRARVDELRTRRRKSRGRSDERGLRRGGVDHQRLARADVVRLPADDDPIGRARGRRREADARNGRLPVDGVADRDAGDGARRQGRRRWPRRSPRSVSRLQGIRFGGSTLIFVRLRDLPRWMSSCAGRSTIRLRSAAARTLLERAREEIRAGAEPGDLARAAGRAAVAARRPAPAPRAQRDRRARPHEPRPRAARRRPRSSAIAEVGRLLEPRVRPRDRRARLAPGPRRAAAAAADRRRGRARRQQQRRRGAARARRARRGPRGASSRAAS